jgi:hypothetical protein
MPWEEGKYKEKGRARERERENVGNINFSQQ